MRLMAFFVCIGTLVTAASMGFAEEIRPGVLRTPKERFEDLKGYPFEPHYVTVLNDMRMHYVDEGEGDPILCLHGEPTWSYLYRKMIPILRESGRVIAPDQIGFGKSDKYAGKDEYSFDMFYDAMEQFIEKLDLRNITLVCQDWGGVVGLPLAMNHADRFARLVIMNTGVPTGYGPATQAFYNWQDLSKTLQFLPIGPNMAQQTGDPEIGRAYQAPFPDASYQAAALVWPSLVPILPDDPAVPIMLETVERLHQWHKPALVMFSDDDEITKPFAEYFRRLIPSAKDEPEIVIEGGGHFLQESKGEEVARHIVEFIERRPIE